MCSQKEGHRRLYAGLAPSAAAPARCWAAAQQGCALPPRARVGTGCSLGVGFVHASVVTRTLDSGRTGAAGGAASRWGVPVWVWAVAARQLSAASAGGAAPCGRDRQLLCAAPAKTAAGAPTTLRYALANHNQSARLRARRPRDEGAKGPVASEGANPGSEEGLRFRNGAGQQLRPRLLVNRLRPPVAKAGPAVKTDPETLTGLQACAQMSHNIETR
eukprot:365470-Chlamydomonas_euryale.AAC.7